MARVPPAGTMIPAGGAFGEVEGIWSLDSSLSAAESQPPPQVADDPWKPTGSVLERLFQSLDFAPTADPDDPRWRRWHARGDDLVEVCGAKGDVIGRYFVRAASPLYVKLEDRRVFSQQGWPLVSGKRSPIRARKVREQ